MAQNQAAEITEVLVLLPYTKNIFWELHLEAIIFVLRNVSCPSNRADPGVRDFPTSGLAMVKGAREASK